MWIFASRFGGASAGGWGGAPRRARRTRGSVEVTRPRAAAELVEAPALDSSGRASARTTRATISRRAARGARLVSRPVAVQHRPLRDLLRRSLRDLVGARARAWGAPAADRLPARDEL